MSGRLYETCSLLVRLGSFAAPSTDPVSSGNCETVMGIDGNQQHFLGNSGFEDSLNRPVIDMWGPYFDYVELKYYI
jgi:hypothetical protein